MRPLSRHLVSLQIKYLQCAFQRLGSVLVLEFTKLTLMLPQFQYYSRWQDFRFQIMFLLLKKRSYHMCGTWYNVYGHVMKQLGEGLMGSNIIEDGGILSELCSTCKAQFKTWRQEVIEAWNKLPKFSAIE